ncbi:HAUS augmin-like complex subunit 6 N-terminus-domain-containing protein [Kalaharituber pfeilii]|nr:HAUS augmin-like complex subunit 6 N-terminus-domain-containing protein [Kalaharituber pfeilii]
MKSSPAVSLLLTNLQLLDYYSSDEAFPISVETFTSLKNKGKAFEHIVHHLFHVFQPAEAATRFHACWPIYEPVQSRELRNVVFKWLTDLKPYKQCITHTPSLALLTPLTLAHQSSLTRLLASRNASKTQWSSFQILLKEKEANLLRLASEYPPHSEDPNAARQGEVEIVAKWINNWLGDERWLDVLSKGDPDFKRDKLLEMGYDKALARHRNFIEDDHMGKATAATASTAGLKNLEKQVEEQKKRVSELKKLRESAMKSLGQVKTELYGDQETSTQDAAPPTRDGLQVTFRDHTDLNVAQLPNATSRITSNDAGTEYSVLLQDVLAELQAVDSAKRRRRPRPIITPFKPPTSQSDTVLEVKGDGPLRKTLLPQLTNKSTKPITGLPKANYSLPTGRATIIKARPTPEAFQSTEQPATPNRKSVTEESDSYWNDRQNKSQDNRVVRSPSSADLWTAASSSLSSPPSLPPPKTRRQYNPGHSPERFQSNSPTFPHEKFSDINESIIMTPHRSRAANVSVTTESTTGPDYTPKSRPEISRSGIEDDELTPKPSVYKKPSQRDQFQKYHSFEDSELLTEQILSKVTNSTYSPELQSSARRPSASPTRINRFGFGFRSPDVSPAKNPASGFNVFEHSELLSFASPGPLSSSSSLPSVIPLHQSSPDYKSTSSSNKHPQRRGSHTLSSSDNSAVYSPYKLRVDTVETSSDHSNFVHPDTTPKEELLMSEDYNSVFKSRPKVALSPPFTPTAQPSVRNNRVGSTHTRLSPEFMSLNSAANTSESEDGADMEGNSSAMRAFRFASPASSSTGGSRIPGRKL